MAANKMLLFIDGGIGGWRCNRVNVLPAADVVNIVGLFTYITSTEELSGELSFVYNAMVMECEGMDAQGTADYIAYIFNKYPVLPAMNTHIPALN